MAVMDWMDPNGATKFFDQQRIAASQAPAPTPAPVEQKTVPSVLPQTQAPSTGIINSVAGASGAANNASIPQNGMGTHNVQMNDLTFNAGTRTAANNWNDADVQTAAKQLYNAMQGMAASGDEAGAKRLYLEKQRQYGFTDAQFSPIAQGANGTAYTAPQIAEWKANPGTTVPQTQPQPQPDTYTPPSQGIIAPVVERAQVTNWEVKPEQTVKRQVNDIIAEDSPLMQQARANALMQMNERGMINSSMATGAAQAAVMDRAIDIGGRDATTYADAARTNAGASNQNSMFNSGQGNQWNTNQLDRDWKTSERKDTQNWQSGENATDRGWRTSERLGTQGWQTSERLGTQGFQSGENSKDRTWKSGESALDRTWKTAEASTDRTWQSGEKLLERNARIDEYKFNAQTQKDLKDLGFKYEKELNADANLDKQYGMFVDSLFRIDSDPNLDAASKDALKYQQFQAFESYTKIRGLKLDLSFGDKYKPIPALTGGSSGGSNGGTPTFNY